ncbi:MAG: hypothetical protein ACR2NH_12925 [Solirubrobacteraceae bacterium]
MNQTWNTNKEHSGAQVPAWLVSVAFLGAAAALAGGFWDDSWHTERGRDTFFVPPHIAIYAGVTVVGAALSLWMLQVAYRGGTRAVLRNPVMLLATGSVAVTLLSGPIDNAWHEAFGRDAVAWSPPHMLGLVGLLGLAASLLAMLSDRRILGPSAGALVIAAATFGVFEYDTDVPQFDSVWYLPALALGASIAAVLVQLTSPRRWSVSAAATVHLAFLGGVSLFLLGVGFPPPALPLLVFPALALDLARARSLGVNAQTALFVVVLYAVYVPVRNFLGDGVSIDALDIAFGLPLALVAVRGVFQIADTRRKTSRQTSPALAAVGTSLVLLLVGAPVALAHDPGQGDPAGAARLEVTARGDVAQLNGAWLAPSCRRQPIGGEVVARRGGQERRARLRLQGCSFTGSVALPSRGRWFVYMDLRDGERHVESWLPVHNTADGERVTEPRRYAYEPRKADSSLVKYFSGALLYAGMVALLLTTIAVLRRVAGGSAPA